MAYMADKIDLLNSIKAHEGWRATPYLCTANEWTIGYGFRILSLDVEQALLLFGSSYKTIQNEAKRAKSLEDSDILRGLMVFQRDAEKILVLKIQRLETHFYAMKTSFWDSISSNLKYHIIEWAYQLGIDGVYKFKKCWAAMENGEFDRAAAEALDSKWAKQTPKRAKAFAEALRLEKSIVRQN